MSADEGFFDTNILLYLLSGETEKADRAEALIAGGGCISVQVLNEFVSVTLRRKLITPQEIGDVLAPIRQICKIHPVTIEVHEKALALLQREGLNICDATIVASALLAGCRTLHTEDLHHGQVFERRLTIQNPFR